MKHIFQNFGLQRFMLQHARKWYGAKSCGKADKRTLKPFFCSKNGIS